MSSFRASAGGVPAARSDADVIATVRAVGRGYLPPDVGAHGGADVWVWDPFWFPQAPAPRSGPDDSLTLRLQRDIEQSVRVRRALQSAGDLAGCRAERGTERDDARLTVEPERHAPGRPGSAGRPRAAVYSARWRPPTPEDQAGAWAPGRPARYKRGRPMVADVCAPDPETRAFLVRALTPGWKVREIVSTAELIAQRDEWRDPGAAGTGRRGWSVATLRTPLIYAPDGREFVGATMWDADSDASTGGQAHDPGAAARRGLTPNVVLHHLLLGRPVFVYCVTARALRGVPRDFTSLAVRPVFVGRRRAAVPPGAASGRTCARPPSNIPGARPSGVADAPPYVRHELAVRAAVGRAAADAVAHAAWRRQMRVFDDWTGTEPAGWSEYDPGSGRVAAFTIIWRGRPHRAADALRRLFLRPEFFPDDDTLGASVGVEAWEIRYWATRFGFAPLKTVRHVLLAFHATRALWGARASPERTARALGLSLRRLDLIVRGCTGMRPDEVRQWGVEIDAAALLDAVLHHRGSADRARSPEAQRPDWQPPGLPNPPAPAPIHMSRDPGRLPYTYARLPRFEARVLPTRREFPFGHQFAYANPFSPYHRPGRARYW